MINNNIIEKWPNCPIQVGKVYRYKELCKQFSEKEKTGDAKVNQLEHWKTCFSWEKVSTQFRIISIYRKLTPRPHKQRVNSKWYKSAEVILLSMLIDTLDNEVTSDNYNTLILKGIDAYIALGLCNKQFMNLKNEKKSKVFLDYKLKFHKIASDMFYVILSNILKSLMKQSIITFKKIHTLSDEPISDKVRLATLEEEVIISDVIHGLLVKFKCRNEFEAMNSSIKEEFYNQKNMMLQQKGFYNCYKVYLIRFTETCLSGAYKDYTESPSEQVKAKFDINKKSCDELVLKIDRHGTDGTDLHYPYHEKAYYKELINFTISLT